MGKVITIDGPAASGKSSVSRGLASNLGGSWVSTGAFYRGLAYVAHSRGIALDNEDGLAELCNSDIWEVCLDPEKTLVCFEGKDVSEEVYVEEVGNMASKISKFPKVRKNLLAAQRLLSEKYDPLIAEGRDCGSVIFPQAELKVFLTAHSSDRAQRRALEEGADIEKIKQEQTVRDAQDSERKSAPLKVPDGAHVVDTSDLDLQQVIQKVQALADEVFEASGDSK